MLPDISSPSYVLFGIALSTVLACLLKPHVTFQLEKQRHNGWLVVDVLVSLSGKASEMAVYFTWKRRRK